MRQAAFFFILLLSLTSCQERESGKQDKLVRALHLEQSKKNRVHLFPGVTRAASRVNLSFRIDGPLIERTVNVGDKVKVGDLLARIDPREFEISLKRCRGELEKVRAELRFAQGDYQRSLNIHRNDAGAISQSTLERKKEDVSHLEGELASLEASVEESECRLSYTQLRSPYAGTIVATYVENYEFVQAKQPIVRLLNSQQIEMVIDVPESLINSMAHVSHITVQFDTLGNEIFQAQIKEIGEESSLTTRTYPVTLFIEPKKNISILAGMAGRAYLEITDHQAGSDEGFFLPATALLPDDTLKKSYVWIIDPETGEVMKREVQVSEINKEGVLVTKGLEKGKWVVTSGAQLLQEGQRVTILPISLSPQGEQIEHSY